MRFDENKELDPPGLLLTLSTETAIFTFADTIWFCDRAEFDKLQYSDALRIMGNYYAKRPDTDMSVFAGIPKDYARLAMRVIAGDILRNGFQDV